MVYYKELLIGFILTITLSVVLGVVAGPLGSYMGFFLATIIVGYLVNGDLALSTLYGGLAAVLTGILFLISMIIMALSMSYGPGTSMMQMGLIIMIVGIMVDGIIGAVGGLIGGSI